MADGETRADRGVRISISSNVGLAAARETTRYAISGVCLSKAGEELWAIGTDGRMCACAPCVVEDGKAIDRSVIVPGKAAAKASRTGGGRLAEMRLHDDEVEYWVAESGESFAAPPGERTLSVYTDGQFPPYDEVFDRKSERMWVGLNARLLLQLCKAIAAVDRPDHDRIVLGIEVDPEDGWVKPTHGIVVLGNGDAFGMLMPTRIAGDEQQRYESLVARLLGKTVRRRKAKKAAKKAQKKASKSAA